MDRSGTGSRRRGTPSISQMLRLTDHYRQAGAVDALSNASLMEVESVTLSLFFFFFFSLEFLS